MFWTHTHNFWYLYAFILILIYWNLYSYSKFEVHFIFIFILNNMYDAVDFDSLQLNIYTKRKITMNRLRALKYSLGGCMFALLTDLSYVFFAYVSYFFCCKCLIAKTENFDEWFESLESFLRTISSFLRLWI